MDIDVEHGDGDWLDSWWATYAQTQLITSDPVSPWMSDFPRGWDTLDPWWQVYTDSFSVTRDSTTPRILDLEQFADSWGELEPWWDRYSEIGHETAVNISDLLEQSNRKWKTSDSPFDTDPLAADLVKNGLHQGPLHPSNEVEWSRWLAQLIRPSALLPAELFGAPADQVPSEVILEDQLSKQGGSFRRPDILVLYENQGVSIEVELGDENYRKTADTARLVERYYVDREWNHTLLLPKHKKDRLEAIVGPPLTCQGNHPTIQWDDPRPVDVVYWRDVTEVVRSILLRGEIVDDHWAANAYLFCAVAEQQLMNFQPQPVIERLAAPGNVVDTIQPIKLADTLEEQLTYLREMMDS